VLTNLHQYVIHFNEQSNSPQSEKLLQNKNFIIIYSPSRPNLNEFLSFAEHKTRYFEECRKPISCRTTLTSIVFISILLKSMGSINWLVTNILQNIFFVSLIT